MSQANPDFRFGPGTIPKLHEVTDRLVARLQEQLLPELPPERQDFWKHQISQEVHNMRQELLAG